MRHFLRIVCASLVAVVSNAASFEAKDAGGHYDLIGDGKIWLETMTPKYDEKNREETYKIYTHIFDFAGEKPITKGPGGLYTHHRGLFIGWKDTIVKVDGKDVDYDTWHMVKENCTQQHVGWKPFKTDASAATQTEDINWCDGNGKPFITEVRAITAAPGADGARIIDFQSKLSSQAGTIQLKGDLQHAGMQLRMSQEVADEDAAEAKAKVAPEKKATQYILPEGAKSEKDDKVTGAWWVCCKCKVAGKTYYIMHMTHPGLAGGVPVYSIRAYARFGAFWEPTLEQDKPQQYNFRVLVSEKPLDLATCQKLYDAYATTTPAAL